MCTKSDVQNCSGCSQKLLWAIPVNKNGTLHTHCRPYIFYPSPPRGPTHYPHADYIPIHSSSSTQSTKFHHSIHNSTFLHHMHKHNNSKFMFNHMAPSSQSNNQKSLKLQKQRFSASQTTNRNIRARLVPTPHIQTTTAACSWYTYFHVKKHISYNVSSICYMMHRIANNTSH